MGRKNPVSSPQEVGSSTSALFRTTPLPVFLCETISSSAHGFTQLRAARGEYWSHRAFRGKDVLRRAWFSQFKSLGMGNSHGPDMAKILTVDYPHGDYLNF
jgi:hypothetical protein